MTWHLTEAQRRVDAKKAAATRKREGIRPFAKRHSTAKTRVAAAKQKRAHSRLIRGLWRVY